jgi:UDP-2-acetamido-2-deoxy-ribo-hexuluronate aminotransferase
VTRYDTALALAAIDDVAESDEFILKGAVARLETELAARSGYAFAVAGASGQSLLTLVLRLVAPAVVSAPAFAPPEVANAAVLSGAQVRLHDAVPLESADVAIWWGRGEASLSAETLRALGAERVVALADGFDLEPAGRPRPDVLVVSLGPESAVAGIAEAAVALTDEAELASGIRLLRNHGQAPATRFLYHAIGFNCRADEIAARYLLRRLELLEAELGGQAAERERQAARLAAAGGGARVEPPARASLLTAAIDVRAPAPDGLGLVRTRARALHLEPALRSLGYAAGAFPASEALAREAFVLPFTPEGAPGG